MRKFRYFQLAILVGLLSLTSCKKYFEGVNDDPNRPTEVTPNVLLPSTQVFYAYGLAGDISRFTSLITNQIVGADRQFATYQAYSITETDTDNWWKFNHYGGAMFDLYNMIKISNEKELVHYAGIGKIMMAYGLLTATDLVGDLPYSEAFGGLDNLTPKYDTQAAIYDSIQSLLAQGKADIADPATAVLEPGSDDLIYGGDLSLWDKFANVLSARAYLHLGLKDPANYGRAITALAGGFTSAGEDAFFNFGETETSAHPWYQYNDQRGDIVFESFLIDTMISINDPRYETFYDVDNEWLGVYFTSSNSPYFFASFVEQEFIMAEASFQTGDLNGALTAYNSGVQASLDRYGIVLDPLGDDSLFIQLVMSETTGTLTLDKIMTQKYIALFLDPEVFTDWRRTGFPVLHPSAANNTGDVIPTRLPYPQSEHFFNAANFNAANEGKGNGIVYKLWWDN